MYPNEMYHHGIKGMKWGVRRYQNKDGSLTKAGKHRYNSDIRKLSKKKRGDYEADPDKWVTEDLQRKKRIVDAASSTTNQLRNAVNGSSKQKIKMDLSKMSDDDLRKQINRYHLEKQYNDLFAPVKVSKGKDFVKNTLDVGGTVLAVGSSALSVALAIRELKGK